MQISAAEKANPSPEACSGLSLTEPWQDPPGLHLCATQSKLLCFCLVREWVKLWEPNSSLVYWEGAFLGDAGGEVCGADPITGAWRRALEGWLLLTPCKVGRKH